MSDMRMLLEAVAKFTFANPQQKPGDQVRGTEKARPKGNKHPFAGRLVGTGESTDNQDEPLEESLLREYRMFVEADPLVANASAQGTTVANAAPQGTAMQSTQAQQQQQAPNKQQVQNTPGQQQQDAPQQTAQQMAQAQSQLKSNLPQLKNFAQQNEPELGAMNVPKTVDAMTKDPKKLTPTDAQNLARLAGIVQPALGDRTGINQLTGVLRSKTKPPQGQ